MSIESKRLKQMEKYMPSIWKCKTVLYIGAYQKRFYFAGRLKENNCIVDVLEVVKDRCEYLRTIPWLNKVIQGNVIDIDNLIEDKYDLVLWSHGPEMIEKKYLDSTLNKLWKTTEKLLVVMCPWGKYYQKNINIVPFYDKNITALYPEDFKKLRFEIDTIGRKDINGSNILAWKYK